MTSNLKALGLALVAVFAMSAITASAAHATAATFSWDNGTTTLTGESDPESPSHVLAFTPGAITASFTCDEVTGHATVSGTGAASITFEKIEYHDSGTTPEKGVCTGNVNGVALKTPIKFNGCHHHLVAGTTVTGGTGVAGTSEGTKELKCPGANLIEISAAGCLIKIGNQTAGPVFYTTKNVGGKNAVTVESRIGITPGAHHNATDYSTSGFTCGAKSETDGTYNGNTTITGFTSSAETTKTNVQVT